MGRKPSVTFLTGAGISRESGLSTFRDDSGLWQRFNIMEVCSTQGLNRNRAKVLDFHNQLRFLMDKAEPNAAHLAIAAFEEFADVTVVTQNIDDLHERAGSTLIYKVHGSIHRAKLKRYKEPSLEWRQDIGVKSYPEGWERCRGTMRHDVVFFGEQVKHGREALAAIAYADYLVVCGTSLLVYPAAGWLAKARAKHRFYIDPSPALEASSMMSDIFAVGAVEGIPKVLAKIIALEEEKTSEESL